MNYSKTFEVGKKDNERYNLYSVKRKTMMMSFMVFIITMVMVTFVQRTRGNTYYYALLIGIGFGTAGILFFIVTNLLVIKYKLHIFYKRGKIKSFKQQIVMDNIGIQARTENGSVHVPFDRISGVNETKHAFYIYVTMDHVYVFPKDQMNGKTEFDEVRNILRAGLPSDKLKLFV